MCVQIASLASPNLSNMDIASAHSHNTQNMLQGIVLTLYLCYVTFTQSRECRDVYSIGSQIGRGGQATVVKAEHRHYGTRVALKIFVHNKDFMREFKVLNRLKLVQRSAQGAKSRCFPSILGDCLAENKRAIVMEVLYKDLHDVIGMDPPFSDRIVYAQQTLQCVAELHKAGIIHLDLKAENLMVTIDNRVKIVDFGMATSIDEVGGISNDILLGTAMNGAPEAVVPVHDGETRIRSPKGDVWATGLILYELFSGVPVAKFASMFAIDCIATKTTYHQMKEFYIFYFVYNCIFSRDAKLSKTEKDYLNTYKRDLTSCCLFSLPEHISPESFRLCDGDHWLVREYEINLQWMHDYWGASGVPTKTLGHVRQLLEGLLIFKHAERGTLDSALANPLFREHQSCAVE